MGNQLAIGTRDDDDIYIYQNKNKHFKLLFQKESNLNVIKAPQNKKKKKLMANISSHDEGAARAPPLLHGRDYMDE